MSQPGAAARKLEEQRLYLKESTTGHTVQVPAETFLAHYTNLLHSQRDTDNLVAHVEKKLKADDSLGRNGWSATNVIGRNEDSAFKGLAGIAEEIHSHCVDWNKTKQHPKLRHRTTRLICRPNHTTASEVRGGSMKTDARFILLKEDSKGNGTLTDIDPNHVPTSAAVCPAEFKTRSTTELRIDNESKVLGAVGHILYADPCRRSVIAFTIEDHLMRFWYFSRSHIAVSAAFDYHANPGLFIRFVIFMTFAPLEDLGYDPTVKRVRVGEELNIQYRFTIRDKVYQTTGVIYEMNLDIVTRATRVWEVVELDSNFQPIGTHKVLKDVWLYFDATPESHIYNAIFAALRQLDEDGTVADSERPPPLQPGSSLEEDAKHYFMTIVSDSVVSINGQPDEAKEPPEGYVEFCYTEAEEKFAMEATIAGTSRGEVDDYTPQLKRVDRAPYPHKKRTHRRIVFDEVCRTLYKVLSYADFTKGVAQLVYGLEYMRLAGFVHRDISPGNCLIFNGQTKISDLEYARPYAAPGHGAAPLTGTPGFMAVEYQFGGHLFRPQPPTTDFFPGESPPPTPPTPLPWFKFNFLHDLESVLWIYLWFLLDTLPRTFTPVQIEQHKTAILRLNHMLFNFSLDVSAQRLVLMQNCATDMQSAYGEIVDALTKVYGVDSKLPKALQSFKTLSTCYRIVEASQPLLVESPQATHWDRKAFLHKFYKAIHIYLMDAHDQMKDKSDEARPLSDSLREAQHRAQQARQAAHKRPRTLEDNEDYVPPVRPDEDEDSDSTSNGTSSPTEETQVCKKKRQRGGWA
ncbi:hypothetical protein CPB85DRAFT_1401682 [Mucidula mucida]|nr:hypothetical protein CPB85DRAFT_1401682 [Mucidula mucida]